MATSPGSTGSTGAAGPARLRLLPGVVVVPREPGTVQVGLDAPRRAVLPDLPDVRRLLAALDAGRPTEPVTADTASALADLERAGLLIDADELDAAESTPSTGARSRAVAVAAISRHGHDGTRRTAARAAVRVLVDAAAGLRAELLGLLVGAGLDIADGPDDATFVLVAGDREVSRSRLDPWVRDGVPHLVVQARDGGVCVGPLVVPGVTACTRCVDAHLGESDARRPILVELLARRAEPAAGEPLVTTLAVALAVHDIASWAEGDRPGSWSATIEVGTCGSGPTPVTTRWSRHPHCGCSWDDWTARLHDQDG